MTNIPTHLFIGNENQLNQKTIQNLESAFPGENNFEQHRSVIWIEPKKNYLLSDLNIIFEKIKFSLEDKESFFFILKKAHLLTSVCANKLLKTLEEPPPGYKFFLLTNNENSILPTIRSRCQIHHIKNDSIKLFTHPILLFFLDTKKLSDPFGFDEELKKQNPTESETVELLHELSDSLRTKIIKKLENSENNIKLKNKLDFLHEQIKKPPQPGGAKIFWRKLFLNYPR